MLKSAAMPPQRPERHVRLMRGDVTQDIKQTPQDFAIATINANFTANFTNHRRLSQLPPFRLTRELQQTCMSAHECSHLPTKLTAKDCFALFPLSTQLN